MRTQLPRIGTQSVAALLAAAGLAVLAGCAGHQRAPKLSGFLTHYIQLDRVDDTTWRSIDTAQLATFNRFYIGEVKVLASYFEGKPLSEETKQKVADYLRDAITNALSDRYQLVTAPGAGVAEIRAAVTEAYLTKHHLGLTVEGEITAPTSTLPVASVVRTDLSLPYAGGNWDGGGAREIMTDWALRLRKAIDTAHKR